MSVGCQGGEINYNLRVDASQAVGDLRELNRLVTTYVSLARRAGLSGNIIEAIAQLERVRIAIEAAYRSLMLMYVATGPVGWLIGLGGLGIAAGMFADIGASIESETRGR